jgi:hypothetical protein
MKIERLQYLTDLLGKISMMSKIYAKYEFDPLETDDMGDGYTWTDMDRKEIETSIYCYFMENIDAFEKLNEIKLRHTIEKLIYKSFNSHKSVIDFRSNFEDRFLRNASNDTIMKDTDQSSLNVLYIFPERLQTSIDAAFNSFKSVSTENANSFLLDQIDLSLYRALISHPELISSLNWRTFEKLLADILETFKYEVELMQGTKDNGIDVIAIKKEDNIGIHRYLIQAKRWNNKVGIEPVERLLFKVKETNSTKGCLVTTSQFTKGAWVMANRYKYILELKDYENLKIWLHHACLIKTCFEGMKIF